MILRYIILYYMWFMLYYAIAYYIVSYYSMHYITGRFPDARAVEGLFVAPRRMSPSARRRSACCLRLAALVVSVTPNGPPSSPCVERTQFCLEGHGMCASEGYVCVHIYIYMYMYTYTYHICVYIYIYIVDSTFGLFRASATLVPK